MPSASDNAKQKKCLREAAIAARQGLGGATRCALDLRIAGHLDGLVSHLAPRTLGFCWPHRDEPDLRAWVCAWLAAGAERVAALPVVQRAAEAMIFRPWCPVSEMSVDRYGIPHPANGPEIVPELLLVPLNAFDAAGFRIGYGGGYFDRTLARLSPRPVAVGVGYECGRVASALPEGHDLPMDWIVSEAGCARSAGRPA